MANPYLETYRQGTTPARGTTGQNAALEAYRQTDPLAKYQQDKVKETAAKSVVASDAETKRLKDAVWDPKNIFGDVFNAVSSAANATSKFVGNPIQTGIDQAKNIYKQTAISAGTKGTNPDLIGIKENETKYLKEELKKPNAPKAEIEQRLKKLNTGAEKAQAAISKGEKEQGVKFNPDSAVTDALLLGSNFVGLGGIAKTVFTKAAEGLAKKLGRDLTEQEARTLAEKTKAIMPPEAPATSPKINAIVSDDLKSTKINPEIKTVPANTLKLGSDTVGEVDPARVQKYIEDIRSGKSIDPLVVSNKDGQTFVEDGKHRLEAAKQLGITDIPVVEKKIVEKATFTPLKEHPQFPNSFIPEKLDKVITNEKLFQKHPMLKDVTVKYHRPGEKAPGLTGLYDAKTKTISLPHDTSDSVKISSLIHEIQHAIQDSEGRIVQTNRAGFHEYEGHPLEVEARSAAERLKGRYSVESAPEVPGKAVASQELAKPTKFQSRVYNRLKAEHPELKDDVGYESINLKDQAEKASQLIVKDKQQAYRIAMGAEHSADQTSTSVNIALAEQALEEGNHKLYAQLVRSRSLDQTRRGQELVSEKASVTDNSTARYVKELVNSRLEKLGGGYLKGLEKGSPKEKALKAIDKEVGKLEEQLKSSKLDVRTALSLLDKMECL